ncbi:MAG: YbaB/EbfC family nucleoid-associated protein [Christensenellales bacterium]|jgi:DNA-binding YbaB/EbfC family protein
MARNNFGRGMGGGMGNMQQALRQAQKMQEDMQKMQRELEERGFEASSGGGMVTVRARGDRRLVSVEIKPEVVDPDDIEMLQDLVAAAVNAALEEVDETTQREMGKLTGGLNIPGL